MSIQTFCQHVNSFLPQIELRNVAGLRGTAPQVRDTKPETKRKHKSQTKTLLDEAKKLLGPALEEPDLPDVKQGMVKLLVKVTRAVMYGEFFFKRNT